MDCGNFEKLEKFGDFILSRPEPQAVWDKNLSDDDWKKLTNAAFKKEKNNPEKGQWELGNGMPERWYIDYIQGPLKLSFKLSLSSFKHVGLFPEQAINWDFIFEKTVALKLKQPKVLNLFAYTGGASLAAKAAGADVIHVDSVKPVVSWARENMEKSNLDNIRWVIEDVMKFVKREIKRGSIYQGIILDPPAYGRGPAGEKWILEENLNELIKLCSQLLDKNENFFIINLYSIGFSALIVENLIKSSFGKVKNPEYGELFLEDQFFKKLPLGIFYRFSSS
jgi:23S rRNA (cytosine1962-C5)-methyltransferase